MQTLVEMCDPLANYVVPLQSPYEPFARICDSLGTHAEPYVIRGSPPKPGSPKLGWRLGQPAPLCGGIVVCVLAPLTPSALAVCPFAARHACGLEVVPPCGKHCFSVTVYESARPFAILPLSDRATCNEL